MSSAAAHFIESITEIFEKDELDIPISIFTVSDSLREAKPEAYSPQLVGLGPIHHFTDQLQHMHTFKVKEAKKMHHGFKADDVNFQRLVELLRQIAVPTVRASYNVYLNIQDDLLAFIFAVDGLFLLHLICSHGVDRQALKDSSFLSQMVDSAGRRLTQETILKDAMMLENQIPILVLRTILIVESPHFEFVSERFPEILLGFCRFVSPFNTTLGYPLYKALNHAHFLDLLYHLIILKDRPEKNLEEEEEELRSLRELFDKIKPPKKPQEIEPVMHKKTVVEKTVIETIIDISKELAPQPLKKPIQFVQDLLGLPGYSELWSSFSNAMTDEPPEEQVLIPRAQELHNAGVEFKSGHITGIKFDQNKVKNEAFFHLPPIKLSGNSEVLIRNLVTYEAMTRSETEPLVLTRYFDLMSGLIKTAEDVKVLKNDGIIKLKSIDEEQVAKAFSGMSKSVRSTNTDNIDEAIEGVKSYYDNLWKVSACKSITKFGRRAGPWCKLFAVILVLLLLGLQSFCSVYECHHVPFKSNKA